MKPNRIATYIDAHTKEVISRETFIDPYQRWFKRDGEWIVLSPFDGYPTDEWFLENPKPK